MRVLSILQQLDLLPLDISVAAGLEWHEFGLIVQKEGGISFISYVFRRIRIVSCLKLNLIVLVCLDYNFCLIC